jgi:hypothetical protein
MLLVTLIGSALLGGQPIGEGLQLPVKLIE